MENRMQPPPASTPLSLDDIAHLVERQCGMTSQDAHALLEDILAEVGNLLEDIETARQTAARHIPPGQQIDIPDALPYTEEWDPDFDPHKGLLLLRPDGRKPKS